MIAALIAVMYAIHLIVNYFVAENPLTTFFVGAGILLSIAVTVDRKNGRY